MEAARTGGKFPFAALGVTPETSFDDFVRIVADTPDEHSERHFRSQSWFISINGTLITDFIGKIESFHEDWEKLRQEHDLPKSPHKNRSSMGERDFANFYSKETYQLALERYRTDINLLGYENDV